MWVRRVAVFFPGGDAVGSPPSALRPQRIEFIGSSLANVTEMRQRKVFHRSACITLIS
jgi:hypothetical protein